MIGLIFIVTYIIGIIHAYRFLTPKMEIEDSFDRSWFSALWIVLVLLRLVHYIHTKR